MSVQAIRRALDERLATLSPVWPTAQENVLYTPTLGTSYQRVSLLPAQTENVEVAGGGVVIAREQGVYQVSLYCRADAGAGAAATRADALRTHFQRGSVLTADSVAVLIVRTPSVSPAMYDGDWYVVPVSVPYLANIFM